MRFLHSHVWFTILAIIFIGIAVILLYKTLNPTMPDWITATVERGTVTEVVSVSGFVEAKQNAELAFPSAGKVTDVFVEEGSLVKAGEVLATLAATQLVAERAEAVSALTSARAAYEQTVIGPREESVTLANTSLANAEANLARVIDEEERKVKNARTALLSTGLTATTEDSDEESTAPIVSGTYTCDSEGTYVISVYSSGSKSGFSYNLSGLETGTETVSTDQPSPLGSCGLYLLFTAGDRYSNSVWKIEVPNTRSATYTTLNNTYKLTLTQAQNAIASAKNALELTTDEAALTTAPARREEITQASAAITQAEARVAAIDARISDRSVVAPFSGMVTDVSITKGETAPATSVITVLADNAFTLKARVPEIDITKISVNQKVRAVFDAQVTETLSGKVTYVSPIATQIDGVAYFETTITLDEYPTWLRAGLNADIDIITVSKEQVLRAPKRFITTGADGKHFVLIPQGSVTATTSVEVVFVGNDSYVEITGLPEGTVIVAP